MTASFTLTAWLMLEIWHYGLPLSHLQLWWKLGIMDCLSYIYSCGGNLALWTAFLTSIAVADDVLTE